MFLSAFGDADIVEEATRMGALGYLVKPLDVRQIVPAVRAALGRWEEIKAAPPVVTAEDAEAPASDEYVAIGILMERLRLDFERAHEALRVQARAEGTTIEQLAVNMVEAANRLNSIRR
jgi:response regulator NasT